MLKFMEPRIIPRKEHRLSRKQVSPNALRTLYRLHNHGFIACLVGGCVRDLLLGRTPKDFDIGTDATPNQIKRLFRNCRLIGRRFRLAHLHFQNEIIEVSTFRRAGDPSDSQNDNGTAPGRRRPWHATDEFGMVVADNIFGTPQEDALRRDFTINALAYNIADASVIDYSTGLDDLRQGLIRSIGDPDVRFTEDPVRMLRAVRFASSHGFTIEPETWEAICRLSSTISRVSSARLYEEVQKLFLLGSAQPTFSHLERSGLLAALFPGLGRWILGRDRRFKLLESKFGFLDQLHLNGTPASPALFLSILFGPGLEKAAFVRHRDGIPRRQALKEACDVFIEEMSEIVTVPHKVGIRLSAMLGLLSALRKTPPRRPASVAARPEFVDALAYLRLTERASKESQGQIEWWEAFLADAPSAHPSEQPDNTVPKKKRKRRRRKPRSARKAQTPEPAQ